MSLGARRYGRDFTDLWAFQVSFGVVKILPMFGKCLFDHGKSARNGESIGNMCFFEAPQANPSESSRSLSRSCWTGCVFSSPVTIRKTCVTTT